MHDHYHLTGLIRRRMNNWTVEQIAFRCYRLSVRLERLAQNFLRMASLSLGGVNGEAVLGILRKGKVFLELTAILYLQLRNLIADWRKQDSRK